MDIPTATFPDQPVDLGPSNNVPYGRNDTTITLNNVDLNQIFQHECKTFFDAANKRFFDDRLSPPVYVPLTLHSKAYGHHAAKRYCLRGNTNIAHELALNVRYFQSQTTLQIAQTFFHELVHHWREDCGTRGPRGYHDRTWGKKMESCGLMPSATGEVGGKKTGYSMLDYVIIGGPFEAFVEELVATGFSFSFVGITAPRRPAANPPNASADGDQTASNQTDQDPRAKGKLKTPFVCRSCNAKLWAKLSSQFDCRPCKAPMISQPS